MNRMLSGLVVTICVLPSACGSDSSSDVSISGNPPRATETSVATTDAGSAPATTVTAATGGGAAVEAMTDELQVALDDWRALNGAPGVALSIRLPGEEPIALVSGVADLTTDEPVTPDDYFRIASITKPMTSAIIMQLVDEGLVDLDEPVSTYLGDWIGDYPYEDDITVRELLDHTNGFVEFAFDPGFYAEAALRQTTPYQPEEILDYISRQEPLAAPGTEYHYETGAYVAAGLVIEAVTGNSAAEEMNGRIFDPAGAPDIYLTPEEFPPESVVHGYVRAELYNALTLLPGIEDVDRESVKGEPVLDVLQGEQAVLQSAGWTGGGNEAQVDDVSAIFEAMFDGTILSEAGIAAMTDTVLDSNYGLGIDVTEVAGHTVYQHGGGVPGFRSQAGYLPDDGIAYAFSSTLIPLPAGEDVDQLRDAILEIIFA